MKRTKEAKLILAVSVSRRKFSKSSELKDTRGDCPAVMKAVAEGMGAMLVDIRAKTMNMLKLLDVEKKLYLQLPSNKNENYLQGVENNTHLNEMGTR